MRRTAAIVVALVLLLPSWPEAHEIPADVTVQVFVAPEGGMLRLLVRTPLFAMREFDFPVRDPGYLEIAERNGNAAGLLGVGVGSRVKVVAST